MLAHQPGSPEEIAHLLSVCRPRLARIGSVHEARWIVDDVVRRWKSFAQEPSRQDSSAGSTDSPSLDSLLEAVLCRREASEPLAYILGSWAFRSHEFVVGPGALIPRPETEELVEHVLNVLVQRAHQSSKFCIADLGAGTGCIGLSLALEMPQQIQAEIHLVERSSQAWPWLEKNYHDVSRRIRSEVSVTLTQGDWQRAELPLLDVIVSNPPYVSLDEYQNLEPSVRHYEPRAALVPERPGVLDPEAQIAYREIFQVASVQLHPEGELWLELGPAQVPSILELAEQSGFRARLLRDMAGHPRFVRASKL